jgi:demethylmenaquinone methyltransferase / 2-methoxy-6-polyprenyl-1,4-benzoquinol methylase
MGQRVTVTLEYRTGRLPPDAVRAMFDRIAPVYDAMNGIMSAGLDQRWRRITAEAAVRPGDRVLDACCGTGDLALAAQAAGGRVTGLDFSERMLERAVDKSAAVEWKHGDALALPFPDDTFDAVTVGFGVRNLEDLGRGLGEFRRVLRKGGRLAVLEITRPRGFLAPFYRLWFDGLVPVVGRLLPGGSAYTYLPASVRRFPGPAEFAELMRRSGFDPVVYRLFAGGIVALHLGEAT